MRERDYKFFNVAREMAKLSTWSEVPCEQVGAIIVLRNEIIAASYNRKKTNPFQAHWATVAGRPQAIYPHAEISCLAKLVHNKQTADLHLAKVYVFRETKVGLGLAKPCDICTPALKYYGVKNVFYTTDNGYAEEAWK